MVDEHPTAASSLPTPESGGPGLYLYPDDPDVEYDDRTYRRFDGENWVGPVLTQIDLATAGMAAKDLPHEGKRSLNDPATTTALRIGERFGALWGLLGWMALVVFMLIVLAVWLAMRGGGDGETTSPTPAATATSAPATSVPATSEPGPPDSAAVTTATGSPQPTEATSPVIGETAGSCLPRTYTGSATATVESLPGGTPATASAEFTVGPDCVTEARILWMGFAYDADWVTPKNPDGLQCTMVEGHAGAQFYSKTAGADPLKLTPDGSGGGTLRGWMTASSGLAPGTCPTDAGPYLGQPVGGTFEGAIGGDTLTGRAHLTADGSRTITVTVEAAVAP